MQSSVQEIKSAIRVRILQVANNVENYRLDNVENELNLILTFLSELSYHEDLSDCMNLCRHALLQLSTNTQQANGLQLPVPPDTIQSSFSGRGRPAYNISENTLVFFIENSFTIKQMASMLMVSEKTIVNRMKEFGLSIRQSYSEISDEDLIEIVSKKVTEFPSVGYRSIKGHLHTGKCIRALPIFTPVAGRSYAHFMEQNGGAQYVNSLFGRYFHFC